MRKQEPLKTWACPGDIECQETDTGVLLAIRQPKNSSFAIKNEKGLLLEIFVDPTGEQIEMIRGEGVFIKDVILMESDKFLGWNDGDRAMLINIEKKIYVWGASAGLSGDELNEFVETKMKIVIKKIFTTDIKVA
ncbi:MAG: hypothetical protein Q8O83_02650 [bacterium]|nr:hypothetical protein [bacterium]